MSRKTACYGCAGIDGSAGDRSAVRRHKSTLANACHFAHCCPEAISVATMVTREEYLNAAYSPDREYADGVVVERNAAKDLIVSFSRTFFSAFVQSTQIHGYGPSGAHEPSPPDSASLTYASRCAIRGRWHWRSRHSWPSKFSLDVMR